MPFVKGQSGNPKGAPEKKDSLAWAMREFLKKENNKDAFIQNVYQLALKGDQAAMKLIWNYVDGMPKQSVDMDVKSDGEKIVGFNFITPTNEKGNK